MVRRRRESTPCDSSAAAEVYKSQLIVCDLVGLDCVGLVHRSTDQQCAAGASERLVILAALTDGDPFRLDGATYYHYRLCLYVALSFASPP